MPDADPRPPDAAEIIARATGGARVTPGSRAAMAHGDPTAIFRRYEQAADPQWEQFQNTEGEGTPPLDVMGMIDLAGGDEAAAGLLAAGPYEVIPFPDDPTESPITTTTGEYFRDYATRYLETEGFYDEIGYGYTNRGTAPSTALISSIGTAPADITYSPTSTTNPARPRTVAAGYDKARKVMTVIFRDGTFYNYYSVSGLEWGNFKRSRSKGRFIRIYLDAKTRGVAAMGMVPRAHQELLYKVARTSQVMRGGYTGTQKVGSKRGTGGKYAYGRPGTVTSGGRAYGRATGRYRAGAK
jgi:KTSC domain